MANDDFFAGLDEAEARIQDEKPEGKKSKVRYWYEDGYVPGNEKDTDDEESTGNNSEPDDDRGREDSEKVSTADVEVPAPVVFERPEPEEDRAARRARRRAQRSEDQGSDSDHYEDVVPRSRGGRFVRWGGLGGKLCLADGDAEQVPPLEDVLDELLLLPSTEAHGSGAPSSSTSSSAGAKAEEAADIVLSQVAFDPDDPKRCTRWSHGALWEAMGPVPVDASEVRERFVCKGDAENRQVRSTAEPVLTQMAINNHILRRQERQERLAKSRREALEAEHRIAASASASASSAAGRVGERPLGASQAPRAPRERKAEPAAQRGAATEPRRGLRMLPGALAKPEPVADGGGASSSSSRSSTGGRQRPIQVMMMPPRPVFRSTETGLIVHTGPLAPVPEEPPTRPVLEGRLPAAEDFCRMGAGENPWGDE